MAKKSKYSFKCTECGALFTKWSGQCSTCHSWSSLEEYVESTGPSTRGLSQDNKPILMSEVVESSQERILTAHQEFDRVLGGGFVPGSLLLLGGDPGIGKSTILLQMTAILATAGLKVLYVTGEESLVQVKQRAKRLGVPQAEILLLCETNLTQIMQSVREISPDFLIVDSIQTVFKEELPGTPGSVSQVRECTLDFMVNAKGRQCTTILVGHVTKEGQIAGPRILEHMVDTVVYFEGDRNHQYRLLRTIKNRFGSTNELGVLEMTSKGLLPVENPSKLFIQEEREEAPGNVVSCSVEGSRCLLFEIQALTSTSSYSVPQRVALGIDPKRLTILLALLEKFGGVHVGNADVFVSVVGGLKVQEPATDLAVALAIAGNFVNQSLPSDTIVLGELGLSGEVRSVTHLEQRLQEAFRLGFRTAIIPHTQRNLRVAEMKLQPVKNLTQSLEFIE